MDGFLWAILLGGIEAYEVLTGEYFQTPKNPTLTPARLYLTITLLISNLEHPQDYPSPVRVGSFYYLGDVVIPELRWAKDLS